MSLFDRMRVWTIIIIPCFLRIKFCCGVVDWLSQRWRCKQNVNQGNLDETLVTNVRNHGLIVAFHHIVSRTRLCLQIVEGSGANNNDERRTRDLDDNRRRK